MVGLFQIVLFCFVPCLRMIFVANAQGITALQFVDVTMRVFIGDTFTSTNHPTFEVTEE